MAETFQKRRATKSQVRLKIGIQGPSGSGKTEGALALATSLMHQRGFTTAEELAGKIALVDAENDSASLYGDRFVFDSVPITAPYSPERFIQAMKVAMDGAEILIVDTISHEWFAPGGVMSIIDEGKGSGHDYTAWAKVTPRHDAFVGWMLNAPIDIIATMRSKQAYVLEENDRGKKVPRKVGMEPVQRPGLEFEFSLVIEMDMEQRGLAAKNRTGLFINERLNMRDPTIGARLHEWRETGTPYVPPSAPPAPASEPVKAAVTTLEGCLNAAQMAEFWTVAKGKGYTAEDVKAALNVEGIRHIPATRFKEAMDWANAPKTLPRVYAEGEEDARELAKELGVTESDLIYEVASARNSWVTVAGILRDSKRRIEAEALDDGMPPDAEDYGSAPASVSEISDTKATAAKSTPAKKSAAKGAGKK